MRAPNRGAIAGRFSRGTPKPGGYGSTERTQQAYETRGYGKKKQTEMGVLKPRLLIKGQIPKT
ncbi:MAG: hypothetical protein OEV88_15035, partial [Gammaproteobacteria bacterium]|nr:hypothetical protein [Gammaproteobacteria bacterium]